MDPSPDRAPSDEPPWQWRFQTPLSVDPGSDPSEQDLGTAWLRLQLVHTSVRHIDPKDYRELSERLEALERLFFERPELQGYYDQCFAPESDDGASGHLAAVFDSREVRHVAAMQAQFLEDLFYILDLDRYGNASDNRGWMNLFRRWGRSPSFNRRLDALRSTLTLGFLEFYDLYLRYHACRVDEMPIPHPWDAHYRRRDYRWSGSQPPPLPPPTGGDPGPCGDPRVRDIVPPTAPLFPGLFLDSGIQEVEEHSPAMPGARSGQGEVGSPGGGQRGQEDLKGGQPGPAGTPPSDLGDSSAGSPPDTTNEK
jgi:hypothetical protein